MPYHPGEKAQELIDLIQDRISDPTKKRTLPSHVAIIMDGNGRWAEEQGLPRTEGHRTATESVRSVSRACRHLGIPHLTLYSFSTENWKRPRMEVAFLMRLLYDFLRNEVPEMVENEIRLSAIGNLELLPGYARNRLYRTIEKTSAGNKMNLCLALSYGSRDEIIHAVQTIAREVSERKLTPEAITPELFSNHLYTAGMPDPDLLIRTSGEFRISNFLLWQISYSEIIITRKLWPDFRDVDFYQSVLEYLDRDRRFGRIHSQSDTVISNP